MDEEVRQYVVFRVGSEEYGLPISLVNSIIRYEEPTPVPRAPEGVLGVINLRGMVVPVVDLRDRFGAAGEGVADAKKRIVVTESSLGHVGLVVDAATEVIEVPADSIQPAPETALSAETAEAFEGLANVEGRLVILLRLDKALPNEEYASIASQEEDSDV
ncbi:MAG: chemotaxis protein CheW [Coriobacteriia bacterium]